MIPESVERAIGKAREHGWRAIGYARQGNASKARSHATAAAAWYRRALAARDAETE